jgi:hypothetical protein
VSCVTQDKITTQITRERTNHFGERGTSITRPFNNSNAQDCNAPRKELRTGEKNSSTHRQKQRKKRSNIKSTIPW